MSNYPVTAEEACHEVPPPPALVVDRDSPAFALIARLWECSVRPGAIVPCTAEELESLRTDCLALRITGGAS